MFYLMLMLCVGSQHSSQCGIVQMPGPAYTSEQACKAEGSTIFMDHLMPKDGDGGMTQAGFICLSRATAKAK